MGVFKYLEIIFLHVVAKKFNYCCKYVSIGYNL